MAQAAARAHDPVDGSHQATGDSARLKFLGIDANTSERLRGLKPLIAGELPRVAAEFYAHVGAWPALAAMLGDSANIERLKRTHEGALWFVSRAWNWPGHHGTQTRVGRWKFTAIIERPKEAT